MLTKEFLLESLTPLNIEKDSILLVHSSLKSLGMIDGGAETVISVLEALIPEGTLVMPTLSQKNWDTVFEDWHMDRPSDTGLITEVFRKQSGSLRSDNATHSVAARGRLAHDLVSGNPTVGARFGVFGNYCFSHESPWQRMYESRIRYGAKAYVLFWGVDMMYHTFKHFCEYRFVEEILNGIPNPKEREAIKNQLTGYPWPKDMSLLWPFYNSQEFAQRLFKLGLLKRLSVGNGEIFCCDIFECVNATDEALRNDTANMLSPEAYAWYLEAKRHSSK